jgi:hypothetical protein
MCSAENQKALFYTEFSFSPFLSFLWIFRSWNRHEIRFHKEFMVHGFIIEEFISKSCQVSKKAFKQKAADVIKKEDKMQLLDGSAEKRGNNDFPISTW